MALTAKIKLRINALSGWQRLWFVLSALLLLPIIFLWAAFLQNPLSGFLETRETRHDYNRLEELRKSKEVECYANKKWAQAEREKYAAQFKEIDAKLARWRRELQDLESRPWEKYTAKGRAQLDFARSSISNLEAYKKQLESSDVLKLDQECQNLDAAVLNAKRAVKEKESEQYRPVKEFLITTGAFVLIFVVCSALLYAIGYAIGWIYKGFKK